MESEHPRTMKGCVTCFMQAEERRKAAAAVAAERAKLEEAALPLMLDAMWAANVLDIQHTVKAVCHEVGPDSERSASLCLWNPLGSSSRRAAGEVLCFSAFCYTAHAACILHAMHIILHLCASINWCERTELPCAS